MDEKYVRAMAVGLAFGALMTGCNAFAYWYYLKQMDDYWASGASRLYDNLCVGVDTFFYLIIPTAAAYFACGLCGVACARRFLEWRAQAAHVSFLAGLVAAVLSVTAAGLLIMSGLWLPGATFSGWILIYGMYSVGGIVLATIIGILYYDHLVDRAAIEPR